MSMTMYYNVNVNARPADDRIAIGTIDIGDSIAADQPPIAADRDKLFRNSISVISV